MSAVISLEYRFLVKKKKTMENGYVKSSFKFSFRCNGNGNRGLIADNGF